MSNRVTLRVQLAVGGAALLALALVAFGTLAYRFSIRAVTTSAEQRARVTALSMAQRAAGPLRAQLGRLAAAAADPAVVAALKEGAPSAGARAVLERLPRDSVQTVELGLRGVDGRTVLALRGQVGPLQPENRSRSDSAQFGRIVARGDTGYYEMAAPVFEDSILLGSVVRIRRLTASAASIRTVSDLLGRGGELLFGNADGSLWTDVARPVEQLEVSPDKRYRREGRLYIADSARIEGTPFAFAVGFPEEATLASVRRLFGLFCLIGGAILALGLGLAWWGMAKLTRPLARLAAAADRLSAEHADAPPADKAPAHELLRLQRAFRTMEDRVRAAHADLAEKVRALQSSEEQLRRADHRKDVFLATLAHELRNPLAPIRNGVQILQLRAADQPELRWATDVIDRQARHMTRLLDELLDLARIANGRLELRREPIDGADVLRQAVETSRPLIDEAGHRLTIELPDEPLPLHGDPVRLCQVFANLLNNAVKFTGRGGEIRLAATTDRRTIRVVVSDDGIGIAPDQLGRIFEPFAQAPLARSGGGNHGLGIGLSLVRSIVALHGGTVEAASDGLGRGCAITVTLPSTPAAASPPEHPAVTAASPVPRRVLIADDVRDNTDSLASWLRLQGHQVTTAYDGESAVAAAEATRPEFVLLDLGMPPLDGYETCRRIRASAWGQELVVVALTGWGREADRQQTAAVGFDFHLVKPVDPASLLTLLASSPGRTSGPFRATPPV